MVKTVAIEARPSSTTEAVIQCLRLKRDFRFLCDETGHVSQTQAEHWPLMALCAAGDVPRACAALDEHIGASLGALLDGKLAPASLPPGA